MVAGFGFPNWESADRAGARRHRSCGRSPPRHWETARCDRSPRGLRGGGRAW